MTQNDREKGIATSFSKYYGEGKILFSAIELRMGKTLFIYQIHQD